MISHPGTGTRRRTLVFHDLSVPGQKGFFEMPVFNVFQGYLRNTTTSSHNAIQRCLV